MSHLVDVVIFLHEVTQESGFASGSWTQQYEWVSRMDHSLNDELHPVEVLGHDDTTTRSFRSYRRGVFSVVVEIKD